jgi:hypothetical protein
MTTRKRQFAFAAILACVPVVALVLLEGIAGFASFTHALFFGGLAEQRYTERDTLVGWISLPNVHMRDMYGKGRDLQTNSQRLRHVGEVSATPPAGRRRVVCSGDSFTLGYGVGDADPWCEKLERSNPVLETLNMGQGGYGIDQAYLWYVRDGLALHANVHIFAFINGDLVRMKTDRFLGYPKPQLALSGGTVHATGVPVPNKGLGPAMVALGRAVPRLRLFDVLQRFAPPPPRLPSDSATWEIAHAALRDLAKRDSAAGIELVVVFLPGVTDFYTPVSANFRRWLHEASDRKEFRFVDLVDPLRRVSSDTVTSLFIGEVGHYTVAGNAWVADQLLRQIPELASKSRIAVSER